MPCGHCWRVPPGVSQEGSGVRLCRVEGRWDSLGVRCPAMGRLQPLCFALEFAAGRRHLAVDCNFIMSQVPNMPLANKGKAEQQCGFFLSPENKHFPVFCTM